jgi:hypothetical protein
MPKTKPQLFKRIEKLADTVKQEFKTKGVVIPHQRKDGTIQIGSFTINKKQGVYWIKDYGGYTVAGPINLAQTAAVLANDLALGRMLDTDLLNQDQWYGYKEFDEQLSTTHAESAFKRNDIDHAVNSLYRAKIAGEQKLSYLRPIDYRFAKLRKLT